MMTPAALKRRRVAAGLTQAEVAARMDVTPNTIARWERGEVRITAPMARLLALVLPEPTPQTTRRRR